MKTKFKVIAFLGYITTAMALGQQSDLLAYNQLPEPSVGSMGLKKSGEVRNSSYISEVSHLKLGKTVNAWQTQIAQLNLNEMAIHVPEDPSLYEVVLRDKNVGIHARYDASGNLISSIERYKNTRIPYKINREIVLEYPGWNLKNSLLTLHFRRGSPIKKEYKIQIQHGSKRKTLKF
nr:hypothetical protein [Allomuricauda sp.]